MAEPSPRGTPGSEAAARKRRGSNRAPSPVYGAIDLGTNNCRMLLAQRSGTSFHVVDAFSRVVRLGEGITGSGALSQGAMDRAVEALKVCADKIRRQNVVKHRSIATQACRMADNGAEFLERVERETGLTFDLISAEEEARLAVHGSVSTELSWVDLAEWRNRGGRASGGRPPMKSWTSTPVGVVTLSERFPEREDRAEWYNDMKTYARDLMKTPRGAKAMRPLFRDGRAHLVGTSGTVTSMAGVHLRLPRYDRSKVDGLWMTGDEALDACKRLRELDFHGRSQEPTIGSDRAELVLAGCAIYEAVAEMWPAERLRVGDRGLREGMLLNLMRKSKKRRRRRKTGSGKTQAEAGSGE